MSQQLPRDGVALVVEGAAQFISNMNKAGLSWDANAKRWRTAEGRFAKMGTTADKTTASVGKAGKAAGGSVTKWAMMASGIGATVEIVGKLVKVVAGAIKVFAKFMSKNMMLAGQFQEMEFTALAVGQAMGITQEQVRGATKDLEELGIRTDVASKTVAQFARNQLDLSKSTDLVRIAQATAVMLNEDSSASMESLTRAITTGSTVMLRRMGIMLDNKQVEDAYKKSIGAVNRELSQNEKMTARTNAIIESGANLLGVYDAAMESPTKRLRSLTGRLIPSFQAALGAPFLDAWSTVIKTVSGFVKGLTAAVQEGGKLYPIMVALGAMASVWADVFSQLGEIITKSMSGIVGDANNNILQLATDALIWGVEIISEFTTGMVNAASTVLIQGLNFIGGILESWLLGASPPKIAPGIREWGMRTFEQYLEGMTEADFGILEAIQGPMKKILEGPAFANISKTIASALTGGDREAVTEAVTRTAGIFGNAINKMVGLQFELADATEAVREQEEALEASRQRILDQQGQVNREVSKYNELLREGADPRILAEQLAQINASEESLRLTQKQATAQEDAIVADKARIQEIQSETGLQKKLIDQMMGVNDALGKQNEEREKGKKGKGVAPGVPEVTGLTGTISSRMGDAIDKMKEKLKEKFKDIFAPLGEAWDNIVLKVGNIGTAWEDFKTKVGNVWDDLKERFPVLQDIEDLIQDLKTSIPELATELATNFFDAWSKIWGILIGQEDGGIMGALQAVWDFLEEQWATIMESDAVKALLDFKDKVLEKIKTSISDIIASLGELIEKFKKLSTADWQKMFAGLNPFVSESPSPLGKGLKEINAELAKMGSLRMPQMGMVPQLAGAGAGVINNRTTTNMFDQPVTIQFNAPITIGSGQQMAGFESAVSRAVRKGLETR